MMIGEGAFADNIDPARTQRPEEPVGIADPGKGQDAFASQCRYRGILRLEMCRQHRFAPGSDVGSNRLGGVAIADDDQRVGASKLRRQRRAQRTRGKHASIAETALAVDHDQ